MGAGKEGELGEEAGSEGRWRASIYPLFQIPSLPAPSPPLTSKSLFLPFPPAPLPYPPIQFSSCLLPSKSPPLMLHSSSPPFQLPSLPATHPFSSHVIHSYRSRTLQLDSPDPLSSPPPPLLALLPFSSASLRSRYPPLPSSFPSL